MKWLVTDQGSHFKASFMDSLALEMRIQHHFKTAYCLLFSCIMEWVCKEVLRIARAWLSEWMLSASQWPAIIDANQRVMKQSPIERLGRNSSGKLRCPLEILTDLEPATLLLRPSPLQHYRELKVINAERCHQLMNIDRMHEVLA